MSNGNPFYINTYQSRTLKDTINSRNNSDTDFLLEGVKSITNLDKASTSFGVADTLQNRVKAWILSKKGDYTNPQKGGCIISLIGNNNIFNSSYTSSVSDIVTTAFNRDFAGDASLQYVSFNVSKVNANKSTRVLELHLVITDIATGKTISMNETIEG